MQILNNQDIMNDTKVHSLSIGDSGKGKTWFIGTICGHGNPFIIDSEGGLKTIRDKKFEAVQVNGFQEFKEAVGWFMQNYQEKGYTHLVVDSFTRLQQYLIAEQCGDNKPNFDDWAVVLASLRKVVNFLTKECPVPVHMTAMAMESKDELSGMVKVYPNIQGSFKFDLAGYFDVVLYHNCGGQGDEQKYWVQAKGDERITARSRLQGLNKYEPNDYSIIVNLLKGE